MNSIYEIDSTNTYRYALGKVNGDRILICIALNPSTADAEKGDRTYTFCLNEAKIAGYNGFVMMNLYPLRSTNPNNLPDKCDKVYLDKNLEIFKKLLIDYPNADIWASWGDRIKSRTYLLDSLKQMCEVSNMHKWLYYGRMTKSKNPRHPSRVKHNLGFNDFSISEYMKGCIIK